MSSSSKPTVEYQRHHDVAEPQVDAKAFRQGWRVKTRLDGLLVGGLIDRAAWQAGDDFRSKWERAFGVGLAPEPGTLSARSGCDDRHAIARLDAAGWLRAVARRLGAQQTWLIERCAVHDTPWEKIAVALGVSHNKARALTAESMTSLAEFAKELQ